MKPSSSALTSHLPSGENPKAVKTDRWAPFMILTSFRHKVSTTPIEPFPTPRANSELLPLIQNRITGDGTCISATNFVLRKSQNRIIPLCSAEIYKYKNSFKVKNNVTCITALLTSNRSKNCKTTKNRYSGFSICLRNIFDF